MNDYAVTVGAGTLRDPADGATHFAHRWTPEGVSVDAAFTGAHLLHLATAGCVLNDVYREAQRLGITISGVRVSADGGFDEDTWASTGIVYTVDLDGPDQDQRQAILAAVDAVAEIPGPSERGHRSVAPEGAPASLDRSPAVRQR